MASETLAAGQSWMLIKKTLRKKYVLSGHRFKYRQRVNADYYLRQLVPDSWRRTAKGSSREVSPRTSLIYSRRSSNDMQINFLFRFWQRRHLRLVMLHLCTKLCANIFILYSICILRYSIRLKTAILALLGKSWDHPQPILSPVKISS